MAWIESHQALGHHPKTIRLAAALRCGVPTVIGYLHLLWWWALDYAKDGKIAESKQTAAARACLWRGEPRRFWEAMAEAGFVDADGNALVIHDWFDYAGRLLDKRAANAERMKDARAKHVQRTSGARAGATVHNQPDSTGDAAAAVSSGQGSPARARGDGGFQPLGSFLKKTTAATAASENLPDEVRERLARPPISSHAVG